MQITVLIVLAILTVTSAVMAVYWGVGAARCMTVLLHLPKASAYARAQGADDRVCVIVPAHNEESIIARLVHSLRDQDHAHLRVLIALDRCTDATRTNAEKAIGDDERFRIVEVHSCPDDWAGKTNAIVTAMRSSADVDSADTLIFTDADTWWDAACVRAMLAYMQTRRLDLASLLCNVTARRWWEWVAQPAAGLELLRQYPLMRSNRPGCTAPFVNGQFIMVRRHAYRRIGGHEAVHDAVLEDLAMGRLAAGAGFRCGVCAAGGMVTCRMYDSWDAFTRGWSRIFAEATRRRASRLRRASWHVRTAGAIAPASAAACLVLALTTADVAPVPLRMAGVAASAIALCLYAGVLAGAMRYGGLPWRSIIAYPIGAWLTGAILARTARMVARRETTRWGGREYRYTPR